MESIWQRGFRLHDYCVEPLAGRIDGPDGSVRVQPKVMAVLVHLAQRAGQVVERDEILDTVWAHQVVGDEVLNRCISELRQALNETPKNPSFIKTVPKRGYRLIAPVSPLDSVVDQPAGVDATAQADKSGPARPPGAHRPWIVSAAVLILSLAGWLVIERFGGSAGTRDSSETAQVRGNALAILPFVNMSDDTDTDVFSDGLADELINLMSRFDELQVSARTSSFYFKDKNVELSTIAEQLRVHHILEGSVRQNGSTLYVTVNLIDPVTGFSLWSDRYETSNESLFPVQRNIVHAVTDALGIVLSASSRGFLEQRPTSSMDAYKSYLRGRHALRELTRESADRAIAQFKRATQIDPAYALAYSGLADAYTLSSTFANPTMNVSSSPIAQELYDYYFAQDIDAALGTVENDIVDALDIALALDSERAEIHVSLALLRFRQKNYGAAQAAFETALSLNPNYADGYTWHGLLLSRLRRYSSAHDQLARAVELDPLSPVARLYYATTLFHMGRIDEAIATNLQIIEQFPQFAGAYRELALTLKNSARLDESIEWRRRAMVVDPDNYFNIIAIGMEYLWLGDIDNALVWFDHGRLLVPADVLINAEITSETLFGERRFDQLLRFAREHFETTPHAGTIEMLVHAEYLAGNYQRVRELVVYDPRAWSDDPKLAWPLDMSKIVEGVPILPAIFVAQALLETGADDRGHELLATCEGQIDALWQAGFDLPSAHLAMAQIRALQGRPREAVEHLQTATLVGGVYVWYFADRSPALASIRDTTEFAAMANKIVADSEAMRFRLASAAVIPETVPSLNTR